MRALKISPASARFIDAGHPWVIRDEVTGDTDGFRPGDPVELVDTRGVYVARALVDPRSRVVARVVARRRIPIDDALFQARAQGAVSLRRSLLADGSTTAVRLINAEGDGLPGLEVDLYGDVLLATRRTPVAVPLCPPVYDVLKREFPGTTLYEKDHFRDLRVAEELPGRVLEGSIEPPLREARERGLAFSIRPFSGLSTGLFCDQRENRQQLSDLAPRTALNAFCYTGAFSVALAAVGSSVISVDQNNAVLDVAESNFVRNGLDPSHHGFVCADARQYLAETRRRFDLVILDPPTFATGRHRGHWSARTGYAALAALALSRTEEGGFLFASLNDRRVDEADLIEFLVEAGREHGRDVQVVSEGRTGVDFPWPAGFPEGRTHRAVLVRLL